MNILYTVKFKMMTFRIDWDKHLIQVSINDEVYLKMDVRKKESYSKALSKNGAYGNSLSVS